MQCSQRIIGETLKWKSRIELALGSLKILIKDFE
jgi:hypothetical protein